jgi:soluble cytochrome b562
MTKPTPGPCDNFVAEITRLQTVVSNAQKTYEDMLEEQRNQDAEIARLRAQNAELLAALKAAERLYQDGLLFTSAEEIKQVHELRRAAIAAAENRHD